MDRVTPLVFRNRGIMQRIMNSTTMLSLHRLILSILYEYWWRVEHTPYESHSIKGNRRRIHSRYRSRGEPNIRKTIALYTKSNTCRREGRENAKERGRGLLERSAAKVARSDRGNPNGLPIPIILFNYLCRSSFNFIYIYY